MSHVSAQNTSLASALSPAQERLFQAVFGASKRSAVVAFVGGRGSGKSTILGRLHQEFGGILINMCDFLELQQHANPLALEETFYRLVQEALRKHQAVLVDDLHMLEKVVKGCRFYPRSGFLDVPLKVLCSEAQSAHRTLVFANEDELPTAIRDQSIYYYLQRFTVQDYEYFCRYHLGEEAARDLDMKKVYRFAPRLSGRDFRFIANYFAGQSRASTEALIDFLHRYHLTSNVNLGEVEQITLNDLKGVDNVIESLEANVVLPLENEGLAVEMQLRPKRGVLLLGPPGTGKTTVGRALAHRMRGKFFLIDGTIISGTEHFYRQIHLVFEEAKKNAPSVIFIDDSDVIFEDQGQPGLYRYLLTMLDGLESESNGRVCVMMTAMDVGNLPPALLRSGRIELWLEMHLPDSSARKAILDQQLKGLPKPFTRVDSDRLSQETEGMTGADLKRLVEDGKRRLAYDKSLKRRLRPVTRYFMEALKTVHDNKAQYAEAEAKVRSRRPKRPPWFDHYVVDCGESLEG